MSIGTAKWFSRWTAKIGFNNFPGHLTGDQKTQLIDRILAGEDNVRLAKQYGVSELEVLHLYHAAHRGIKAATKGPRFGFRGWGLLVTSVMSFLLWVVWNLAVPNHFLTALPAHEVEFMGKTLEEFAIAFFICFVVVRKVELKSKEAQEQFTQELLEAVKKDVFGAMLNMRFPAVMKEEILETMMRTNVYRPRLQLFFEIERKDRTDTDKLTVKVRSEYLLNNISAFPTKEEIKQFIPCSDADSESSGVTKIFINGFECKDIEGP